MSNFMLLAVLVGLPALVAGVSLFLKSQSAFALVVRISSVAIAALSIFFVVRVYGEGAAFTMTLPAESAYVIMALEVAIALFIIISGLRAKRFLVVIFAAVQIAIVLYYEFTIGHNIAVASPIVIDKLSLLMFLVIGVVGSLICIYAVEYMRVYQHHHHEIKDRRNIFFAVLFVFLAAMFGLVSSNDLTLLLFFWEITSLSSYLLIGYSKTEEAINNAFLALTINVFGGLLFTIGIVILGVNEGVKDLSGLLALPPENTLVMVAVFLIGVAGLTKAAQMPFSKWLLGAMVAPTPTSAMLHSSTMVKAGVYLIIRLAPMLGKNPVGITITLIGAITFLVTAILAVSQSDAKKILAYSTISNLGLIVACAGINTAESLWAAMMLIVFHAIAKSLLFLSVGSVEHQVGSRDVEDMDGLYNMSPKLAMLIMVGIAGMFVAPFGMLISKWAAMKAFLDYNSTLVILMLAFGSAVTFFFWTKWMGKLVENTQSTDVENNKLNIDEKSCLYTLAGLVILVCIAHPLVSKYFVEPYISSNPYLYFSSPITALDSSVLLGIMFTLTIVGLLMIPFFSKYKTRPTSIYMAGANIGDNKHFVGSMGEIRKLEMRNWYVTKLCGESVWLNKSIAGTSIVLVMGLLVILGGTIL